MSARESWSVEVIEGCPAGSRVCLGCGALVLDDEAAVDQHRLYHELTDGRSGIRLGSAARRVVGFPHRCECGRVMLAVDADVVVGDGSRHTLTECGPL